MRLLWHLLKNDLRQARWSLLVWSLAQLLVVGLSLALWYAPELLVTRTNMENVWGGLAVIVMIFVAYDFAVRLIHADNPCLPHAFWRTRPISPARLLITKLITLLVGLLLSALPAVVLFSVHVAASGTGIFSPIISLPLLQLAPLATAVLFASFTPSTRHCLLATLLGLFIVYSLIFSQMRFGAPIDFSLFNSRFYLGLTLFIGGACFAVWQQYRSARFYRALLILGLSTAAAFTTPYWWHWRFISTHSAIASSDEPALTRDIALQSVRPLDYPTHINYSSRNNSVILTSHCNFSAVPAGHVLRLDSVRQTWPDGTVLENNSNNSALSRELLTVAQNVPSTPSTESLSAAIRLPKEQAYRLRSAGTLNTSTIECTATLARVEVIYRLPLGTPGQVVSGSNGSRVRLLILDRDIRTKFWITQLDGRSFADPAEPMLKFNIGTSSALRTSYMLVHRPSGEMIPLPFRFSINAFGLRALRFEYETNRKLVRSPEWLAECDLVAVAARPVGRFTRSASVTPAR